MCCLIDLYLLTDILSRELRWLESSIYRFDSPKSQEIKFSKAKAKKNIDQPS